MPIELADTDEIAELWAALTSGLVGYGTWAELAPVSSRPIGALAAVDGTDTASHIDVLTGASTPNSGTYRYTVSGWAKKSEDVYATEARSWAESAEAARGAAVVAKTAAEVAQAAAEDAAEIAVASAPIYSSLVAGEAATVAGQFFAVAVADTYTLYERTAGVSILRFTYVRGSQFAHVANALDGTPYKHGVVDDDYVSDQTTAVQTWMTYCANNRISPFAPNPMRVRCTGTITYDPTALVTGQVMPEMRLTNLAIVSSATTGFVVGNPASVIDSTYLYLPSVRRTACVWAGTATDDAAAIITHNIRFCSVFRGIYRHFTKGHVMRSDGEAWAYNRVYGGDFLDCKYGEVLHNVGPENTGEFTNQNIFHMPRFGYTSESNGLNHSRYGTYFVSSGGGQRGMNNNLWLNASYEMGDVSYGLPAAYEAVPVWFDKCGSYNKWIFPRYESGKGPFMHCEGQASVDPENNAFHGIFNEVEGGYFGGTANQQMIIRQVGGAFGNRFLRSDGFQPSWSSGPLRDLLHSGGAAAAARIEAPYFLKEVTVADPKRQTTFADRYRTNIYGIQADQGVVLIKLDTRRVKTFAFWSSTEKDNTGALVIIARNAASAVLTGTIVDPTWGLEKYVKFAGAADTTLYGGASVGAENITGQVFVTVRDEVASIEVGYGSSTNPMVLHGFGYTAYPTINDASLTRTDTGITPIDPLYEGAPSGRFAVANPFTAGEHGIYTQGCPVNNLAAASGVAMGWTANNNAGALGRARADATAYAVKGEIIIAGASAYYVHIAGTTGTGTGPVGTTPGTNYVDGTVTWRYFGPKATGISLPNYP